VDVKWIELSHITLAYADVKWIELSHITLASVDVNWIELSHNLSLYGCEMD